jgi:malate/lactate dehydrogenase
MEVVVTTVAVAGTGNVGSALLIHLIFVRNIQRILVVNLEEEWSMAAIMDACGARSEAASRLEVADFGDLGRCDVIALTSGAQMKKGEIGSDVLPTNTRIMNEILDQASLKPTAIVIALATPVDEITPHIQVRYNLPRTHVIGFGGDLDRNRLACVLRRRGLPVRNIGVVGEHGAKAIPYYPGNTDYQRVAGEVRNFLASITAYGGSPRNLATAFLLSQLIDDIVNDRNRLHFVCAHHPDFQEYLTWPFLVGRAGAHSPRQAQLGAEARRALELLLSNRPPAPLGKLG